MIHALRKGDVQMTTPIGYSVAMPRPPETTASIGQAYRTSSSFVAVHFDPDGKGGIVFLPYGVILRVIGPSACLPEGFEVVYGKKSYNVFQVDLVSRCTQIFKTPSERRQQRDDRVRPSLPVMPCFGVIPQNDPGASAAITA